MTAAPNQRPGGPRLRTLTLLTRRPELSPRDFSDHWREVHAPLVRGLPGLVRYVQHHVTGSAERSSVPSADYGVDGVVEFIWESAIAMERAFASEPGQAALEDARTFIAHMQVLLVEPLEVIDHATASQT